MKRIRVLVLAFAVAGVPLTAWSADKPAGSAAGAPPAAPARVPADVRGGVEPKVQHLVAEDEAVRIDELRVRGQTQRISVHPKASGMRDYEVLPAVRGRDLSQPRDSVGQRVWSILAF